MFAGRKYAIFSTTDKQSGIDHYEILEIKPTEEIGVAPQPTWIEKLLRKKKLAPNWIVAQMPYPLMDQDLMSIIKVKAIDKAGNERLVEYIPPQPQAPLADKKINRERLIAYAIIISLIITLIGVTILVILAKRSARRRKQYEEDPNLKQE